MKVERSKAWYQSLSETIRRMTDKTYSSNLENYDKLAKANKELEDVEI
jgi:hypothetical protein